MRLSRAELEAAFREKTDEVRRIQDKLGREIQERENLERALRLSEERFKAVFETAQDIIFVKDKELRFTHVNPALALVFQLPASEIIGKTLEDLIGPMQAQYVRDQELRVLAGQPVEARFSLTYKGVSSQFDCIRLPLVNQDGRTEGIVGICRDVTELKLLTFPGTRKEMNFLSQPMRGTLEKARLAAGSDSTVLLLGESGVGKDYFAQYIHDHSTRSGRPFYPVNCAAIAKELADSELFGHDTGAFTGAAGRKRGLLELAEGGTLLLNEIGELPLDLQAKLLSFFDTHTFTRVGGEKQIRVNSRIIAASNRDIEEEVNTGTFRKDLFYRLNVLNIKIPPLRERVEDIPALAQEFLQIIARKTGFRELPVIEPEAMQALCEYHWPGNVRELKNVLERATILRKGGKISARILALVNVNSNQEPEPVIKASVKITGSCCMKEAMENALRKIIMDALALTGGNVSAAARLLGVTRDSLKYHIKHLRIGASSLAILLHMGGLHLSPAIVC